MSTESFLCVLTFVIAYGAVSKRLESSVITPPMCFVAFGMLMGSNGLGVLGLQPEDPAAHLLAELTLVLVLFTDAARIDLRALRREVGLPVRLLAIGMPLSILLGAAVAFLLFPDLGLWEAALLATILAPTDAALGQAVVSSTSVPLRIRQALNVESGLNDGIALPVLMIFVALAVAMAGEAVEHGRSTVEWVTYAAQQVTFGPLAGVVVGGAGGRLIGFVTARDWMNGSFYRLSGLALALLAFGCAEAIGGNGFIAAFAGGLTFGTTSRGLCEKLYGFLEAEGQLLMLLVFMLLGSALAWPALERATPRVYVYALLSLTLLRMVPVAISMIGAHVRPMSTVFLGWFGPRGLASVIFGLLIIEESEIMHAHEIFDVVVVTVLGSVLLHGLSAVPGAKAYGRAIAHARNADAVEHGAATSHPTR